LSDATVNVGDDGAAFGLDDDVVVTVSQLMYTANVMSSNGVLWGANDGGTLNSADIVLQEEAYNLFYEINNT